LLVAVLCFASPGVLLTIYTQQEQTGKIPGKKSVGAKLYEQNCSSCHAAKAEGTDGCCATMSGPNLLSVVSRMNGKEFLDEVRHVGETNMCAGHLLDLSPADVEAIRNYLLELSKQAKSK